MMASSLRLLPSSWNTSGSLGMPRNSATTEWLASAVSTFAGSARAGGVFHRPTGDEEEAGGPLDAVGLDHGEPVLPQWVVGELDAGRPGLRSELEHISGVAIAGDGFDEFVTEVRIGGADENVERGRLGVVRGKGRRQDEGEKGDESLGFHTRTW